MSEEELRRDVAELLNRDLQAITVQQIDSLRQAYINDWNEWPVHLGAPFYDLNGNGTYEPQAGETPGLANADQVIWVVYNDIGKAGSWPYVPLGLGLEIQLTAWGYKSEGALGQGVFQRFRILNKSGFPIDSMFIGRWLDTDIGSYVDDLLGCDSLLNLGYGYNGFTTDAEYQKYGLPPAAFGCVLLQGPKIPSPGKKAEYNFKRIAGYQNLEMTSFYYDGAGSFYSIPSFSTYEGQIEWYYLLNGFIPLYTPGPPIAFHHMAGPYFGRPTKFPVNGDPVSGIGDVDGEGNNLIPGSRQMLVASGPFTMQPGDTQEVITALVGGIDPAGDHLSAVAQLKENVKAVRSFFLNITSPPPLEKLLVQAGAQSCETVIQINLEKFSFATACRLKLKPEIGDESELEIALFDDGQHGDSLAGDGIWSWKGAVENRKYPYGGDLIVTLPGRQETFAHFIDHLRLRPLPQLTNFRLRWEDGRQDGEINSGERVHLAFDILNRDGLHPIDWLRIDHHFQESLWQQIPYPQPIAPGQTVSSDSLFFDLQAPGSGDSLSIRFRLRFDYQSEVQTMSYPLVPWTAAPQKGDTLPVEAVSGFPGNITPLVADPQALSGHTYAIVFRKAEESETDSLHWRLRDISAHQIKLEDMKLHAPPLQPAPVVDGIQFFVTSPAADFSTFEVRANALGTLLPPEGAALPFLGFPSLLPTSRQQSNGSTWVIHYWSEPILGSYNSFRERVSQYGGGFGELVMGMEALIYDDYEIRFSVDGGRALFRWPYYKTSHQNVFMADVPFELWNIADPENPADDFRCVPWINDLDTSGTFNLIDRDHPADSGENDPFTDVIYWIEPLSRDQAGYENLLALHESNPAEASEATLWAYLVTSYSGFDWNSVPGLMQMVLVNWNGGDISTAVYNAGMPETGSVFRIATTKANRVGDSLLVRAPHRSLDSLYGIAHHYQLSQNYPNPFNVSTIFRYSLPAEGRVKLEIYNILGQKVCTLLDRHLRRGEYSLHWDGSNGRGQRLASGIYIYRLQAGSFSKARKLVLLK
ncbi:MAG: hypothetical protein Kow0042_30560 [Calditrichia bacterium]